MVCCNCMMNMQTLSIFSISNIIPCFEIIKSLQIIQKMLKQLHQTSFPIEIFLTRQGSNLAWLYLEWPALSCTSTEHEPDKKFAWLYTAEPANRLAHSWLKSARHDAGENDTLLKRINLKHTAFNVLHAESSENVLIANETSTGLSLNLKTGFYNIQ